MLAGAGETDEDAGLKEIDLLIASPNPGISVLSIRRSFFYLYFCFRYNSSNRRCCIVLVVEFATIIANES